MKGTLISILVGALGGALLTVGSAAVHASHGPAAHRAAQVADPTMPQTTTDMTSDPAVPSAASDRETPLEK
jgi:hypothetical protein